MAPNLDDESKSDIPENPPSYEDLNMTRPINTVSLRPESMSRVPSFQGNMLSPTNSVNNPAKKKNVPYVPSTELQKHINKLGGESSSSLSAVTSETKTEYFDILPSFQMFQSILKRNDFEFDEPTLGCPPVYGDTTHSSATPPTLSPVASSARIDETILSVSEALNDYGLGDDDDEYDEDVEGQYLFSDNDDVDGLQRRPRTFERSPEAAERMRSSSRQGFNVVTHESYGHSVLDNIDKLPHAKSSPLSIEIFVTKDVPIPNMKNDLEIKLKEYTCGDRVNGFVVITNTLDKDVDFGLFTVTLEGTIKTINRNLPHDPTSRSQRIILKKFLKMYDLNASFNEFNIPSSAGVEYSPFSVDILDGCVMGLPGNRILKANTRYKKFITFTFPEMLLDNACPHNLMRHNMPPPSFGIDGTSFYGKSASIEVSKALGYGFLNARGSPVKVRDYSIDDVSVSYTIEAKFIDKRHEPNQNEPVFAHDINDPNNDSKYIISRSSQYFMRFVPDVRTQVDNTSRAYKEFGQDTFETVGIDGVLYNNLTKGSTWRSIKHMNLSILLEIEAALDKQEYSHDELKRKNLLVRENVHPTIEEDRLLRPTELKISIKSLDSDRRQHYHNLRMICNHVPVKIFGKRKKRLLLTSVKIGEMTLYVKTPAKLIPYTSPRLLQRYNNGSELSLTPTTSKEYLMPTISNMEELYNRDDESKLNSVNIELIFDTSEDAVRPPPILLIDTNIVAWSYKTNYPIPTSFEHDFFYTKPFDPTVIVRDDDISTTTDNQKELKDTVNQYINFLKETKTFISQNTYSYLKGISLLGIKKDTIKDFFESYNHHTTSWLDTRGKWTARQLNSQELRWTRNFDVPVKIVNKNNVTLAPSFQSCLVGRLYALQVVIKFKGAESPANTVKVDVPVLVG